ncbi:MAG: class II SORL domain-containing protein [Candidatus Odinarchaeia archaeon]
MSEDFSLVKLNKPTDWSNLSNMAKKHVPVLEAPEKVKAGESFTIKIKVGGIDGVEHPNMLGHWINWIAIHAGEVLLARVGLSPELTNGYTVTLSVSLKETTTLIPRSFCNLHGLWEGQGKKVIVE